MSLKNKPIYKVFVEKPNKKPFCSLENKQKRRVEKINNIWLNSFRNQQILPKEFNNSTIENNKEIEIDEEAFFNNVDFILKQINKIYLKYCKKICFFEEFTLALFIAYHLYKKAVLDDIKEYGFTEKDIEEVDIEAKEIAEELYKEFTKKGGK
jgi:hypothetical protein